MSQVKASVVVDTFVDAIIGDNRLNRFFVGVDANKHKQYLSLFFDNFLANNIEDPVEYLRQKHDSVFSQGLAAEHVSLVVQKLKFALDEHDISERDKEEFITAVMTLAPAFSQPQ